MIPFLQWQRQRLHLVKLTTYHKLQTLKALQPIRRPYEVVGWLCPVLKQKEISDWKSHFGPSWPPFIQLHLNLQEGYFTWTKLILIHTSPWYKKPATQEREGGNSKDFYFLELNALLFLMCTFYAAYLERVFLHIFLKWQNVTVLSL